MKDTSYIRPPVDRQLLKSELKKKNFLRRTNCGDKEIYVTTAHLSPNVMQEIGRLRELSFAVDGGGTGNPVDIDEYDLLPEPYCCRQLFVWSPADEEIVGGYRFQHGSNMYRDLDGSIKTPSFEEFYFSPEFVNDYLPYTVELGRAFVQPAFQPGFNLRKGLYSLDNLWDGLGCIALEVPETRYFFGKITTYSHMNRRAKELILYFYQKYFPDPDGLVRPINPLEITCDYNELHKIFNGSNYKEDFQTLQREVRALGSSIPPLFNAYMNLTTTMKSFGTAVNHEFGETGDTGILITLRDLAPDKRKRYLESYHTRNRLFNRLHFFKIDMKRLPWWNQEAEDEARTTRRQRGWGSESKRRTRREERRLRRLRRRAQRKQDNID
ncbi:MAG: GNAT family N-acetyltransferase [Bacteroidales bacterium]|nr:GNAT family N-acetyltransferase [Bacteroidales bacterium]